MLAQFIYLFLDGYLAFLGSTTPWLFRYLNTSLKWNLVYGFTRPYLWTECPSDKQTYQSQERGGGKSPQNWEVGRSTISSTLPVTSKVLDEASCFRGPLNPRTKTQVWQHTSNNNPQWLILVFHACHKQSALRWQPEIQCKSHWPMSQQFGMLNLNIELWCSFVFKYLPHGESQPRESAFLILSLLVGFVSD